MSAYNDLLIRTLAAIAITWIFASIMHNERLENVRKKHRETINNQLQELRRLRQMNAELSYELHKIRNNK